MVEILNNLFHKKNVGIWGFGKTGQSILEFIAPYAENIFIMESGELSNVQKELIKKYKAQIVSSDYLPQFLEVCRTIIASPGIDISLHKEKYPDLFMTELDLFGLLVQKLTIAITGSIGKTTTVHLLEQVLNKLGKRTIAVGNIGLPMLSILKDQESYDYILLEVSSFQLEHMESFKPDIAAILNILPNHLDRHKTMENYLRAKGQLLAHQSEEQYAILPLIFMDEFWPFVRQQKVHWIGSDAYDYIINDLSDVTAKENIIMIFSILETLGFEPELVAPLLTKLTRPAHRMEFVKTMNGVDFYNDSKATVTESTLKAVEQCRHKPTILLLGGLSKGISREPLFTALPDSIKHVVCFGKEAEQLHGWCKNAVLSSSCYATLEEAFTQATALARPGDIVLLSPAGTSYDLFKDFEQRGNTFKKLVHFLK